MNHHFKKWNNILGWIVFTIATAVYLLTMERHISFWDTGEYIVSSAKLGVTHAPGAALFQLIGAAWSGLAFGDESAYAILINALSAISSGFTILFLFWIITHFAKKITFSANDTSLNAKETVAELSKSQQIIIFASGLVGALAFTFSDTFWYSAVEGEVYAMASTFTALLVWLACKWDSESDQKRADRWLILIAFVIGLSTGVHLMAILAIPVIGYVFYVKKYPITTKSFLIANVIIGAVFGLIFQFIFPYTMTFFGRTEMFAVNELGMPFNSGSILAGVLLIVLIAALLHYTKKWNSKVGNTIVLSIAFMLIGFSCWLVIPIRANANPHMNLNDPDTALGTLDYFNREQYGSWPIFYGPVYTAHIENQGDGFIKSKVVGAEYKKDEKSGKYVKLADRIDYEYNKKHVKFFPKMYNYQPEVMENYANWYGFPEFELERKYRGNEQAKILYAQLHKKKEDGTLRIKDLEKYAEILTIEPPTFGQNLNYFFDYQIGYMFLRYFMWNFSGRQNDWEGHREVTKGNWITGINFLDKSRLGDQSIVPAKYKKNKSRNVYFMLPLILGIIGFLFHLNRNFGIWWAMVVLFLLTSVGIIFYTSVKPFEPRERDYALVSSFFVFCIWIGLGVQAIYSGLNKYVFKGEVKPSIPIAIGAICLGVPLLMGFQNWDDHDRSLRKAASDFAHNYLVGLNDNAILFVYGDNDTYPLWGYQETEGFRKDVKVANFTLLGAPWYIEQVHRKTYDADAIPHQMEYKDYQLSNNDIIQVLDKDFFINFTSIDSADVDVSQLDPQMIAELNSLRQFITKDSMTAKEAMNFMLTKNPIRETLYNVLEMKRDVVNFLPVNKIIVPVNKENAIKSGIVDAKDADKVVDYLEIKIDTNSMSKAELAMLDLLANYNWDRPIYFSGGGLYDEKNIFFLNDYLQYEGMTYKLVPIKTTFGEGGSIGRINSKSLKNTFEQMRWANFNNPKASFDETGRNYTQSYRNIAFRLASKLKEEGKSKEALVVLDEIMEQIPLERFYWDSVLARIGALYLELGNKQKGEEILSKYRGLMQEHVDYFDQLDSPYRYTIAADAQEAKTDISLSIFSELTSYAEKGDTALAMRKFKEYYQPAKEKILAINKELNANPQNDILNRRFESEFQNIQELLGIGNMIDSVYAEEQAEKLFKQLIPDEDIPEAIPDSLLIGK